MNVGRLSRCVVFLTCCLLVLSYSIVYADVLRFVGTISSVTTSNVVDARAWLPTKHQLVALPVGSPASCTVQWQFSLDNVNWFSLGSAQTCTSAINTSVVDVPTGFIRGNVTALSGGTSVQLWYIGTH